MSDVRVLWTLVRGLPRHGSHAERLSAFYAPQADRYDAFRERLLHGRDELIASLPVRRGGHIVELGGGTARNADRFGPRLARLERLTIVDLCPPLLAEARKRAARLPNLEVVEADATAWRPEKPVDCVYFSYALTMIPDPEAAIANALAMLKPGGLIASVDFHVGAGHSSWTRWFWPRWFAHDGVLLDSRPLDALLAGSEGLSLRQDLGAVPYLPGLRVPFYLFVGRKRAAA